MAVAFQISEGHVGYNLDRCEEVLLVDAFLTAKAASLADDPWCAEVERNFFDSDRGVSGRHILEPLNERLEAIGKPLLVFSPSDWTPYMRFRFEERIQARRHLRTLLVGSERAATLKAARADRALLPAAKEGHWWPKPPPADPTEQRRRAAVAAHLTEKAPARPAPPTLPTTPNMPSSDAGTGVDQDGVQLILRALAGIEARLSAIETAIGLPAIGGQAGPLGRVADIEQRLGWSLPDQATDGRTPDGVSPAARGGEAQPPSPSVAQDVNGRYVFAPGDRQPF